MSESVRLGLSLEDLKRPPAKERQLSGLKKGKEFSRSGKLPEREKGDTREIVGKAIGMSGFTYLPYSPSK